MIEVIEINQYVDVKIEETTNTVNIEVAGMGLQGEKGEFDNLFRVSAEPIPSHTPVAIYNNLAYKLDASNTLHQFAFVGFSVNGTNTGQFCEIKVLGEITLVGWGLIPNQQYLAGINGTIITENLSISNFTKVIGYATDSNTLQIIKDSITINKI
jgi:hypothetical protein